MKCFCIFKIVACDWLARFLAFSLFYGNEKGSIKILPAPDAIVWVTWGLSSPNTLTKAIWGIIVLPLWLSVTFVILGQLMLIAFQPAK